MLSILCVSSHLMILIARETKAQRGEVICWGHTAGRDKHDSNLESVDSVASRLCLDIRWPCELVIEDCWWLELAFSIVSVSLEACAM